MRRSMKRSEIDKYLDEEAEKLILTKEDIYQYSVDHSGRDKTYLGKSEYPFGSLPYCKGCMKRVHKGEEVYRFLIGRYDEIFYHINHLRGNVEGLITQDRARRSKIPIS